MWKFLSSTPFLTIAGCVFTFIISCICFKWPTLKRWLQPSKFHQSIITDRDDLQKEVARLFRLKESLFDEVIVLRRVDMVKTALLDKANAEAARVKGSTRKIQELLEIEKIVK